MLDYKTETISSVSDIKYEMMQMNAIDISTFSKYITNWM